MNATGMDAVGADERPFHPTFKTRTNPLQIRSPAALGLVVRVTDVIADGSALAADGAYSRHLVSYPFDDLRG